MAREIGYASYLLRVWWEGEGREAWQGELESIQSGQRWRFADLEAMFDFLRAQILGADQPNLCPGGKEKVTRRHTEKARSFTEKK
jgi:hypothetical protein